MRIQNVEIKNFRGIKQFSEFFGDKNLICFVGRGNSTKSTILEAISLCLSAKWNINITDADFNDSIIENEINISVTLSEVPQELMTESKFGLYIRQFDVSTKSFISPDQDAENSVTTITINLNINKTLAPEWTVISDNLEPKQIGLRERELLRVYLISDYSESHLSWSKGSPLYALQSNSNTGNDETKDIVLDAIRTIKNNIESQDLKDFTDAITKVKTNVINLGGNIDDSKASIDIKDLAFRSNTISLHHGNKIPFRLDGKGIKRLISIAIQKSLINKGGVILVDELEQGLEPDRIKHLVRALENSNGQVFITTHSQNVVEELEANQIYVVSNKNGLITSTNKESEKFQKLYRTCPEAVYASKVIVCEGKTEIGICRAYDLWRIQNQHSNLACKDVVYVYAEGDNQFERAKALNELGLNVLMLCDSDKQENENKKTEFVNEGIKIIDCEKDLDIEHQIFKDVSWETILKTLDLGKIIKSKDYIETKLKEADASYIGNVDIFKSDEGRQKIANVVTLEHHAWFKSIRYGEQFGALVFDDFNNLTDESRLKKNFNDLSAWIDGK